MILSFSVQIDVYKRQEQGFEITYLPVDAQGRVKMSALEAVLRPDTIMVSTMLVNNEVGAVMPVEEIAKMVHEKSPKALYHVDAIQGFGKYHKMCIRDRYQSFARRTGYSGDYTGCNS